MRMIDRDELIDNYKHINSSLQEYGVPIIAQIVHAGGQTSKSVIGEQPVAPTRKRYALFSSIARELDHAEIEQIIDNFVLGIERVKAAGFSGVQLHAAHGYLLYEFLSPRLNTRRDSWGGNTVNRFRIISSIMARAREKVGDYPILVKFSAYDGEKNGIRIDETLRITELFQKSGIDAIEVSCGGAEDGFNSIRVTKIPTEAALALAPWLKKLSRPRKTLLKMFFPLLMKRHIPLYNYNVDSAELIKKNLDIPVIVVGGIRRLQDINDIINNGRADYVSMGRPFIIEPDIVNKFKSGLQTESRCINCGYCIMGVTGNSLRCYHGKISRSSR